MQKPTLDRKLKKMFINYNHENHALVLTDGTFYILLC